MGSAGRWPAVFGGSPNTPCGANLDHPTVFLATVPDSRRRDGDDSTRAACCPQPTELLRRSASNKTKTFRVVKAGATCRGARRSKRQHFGRAGGSSLPVVLLIGLALALLATGLLAQENKLVRFNVAPDANVTTLAEKETQREWLAPGKHPFLAVKKSGKYFPATSLERDGDARSKSLGSYPVNTNNFPHGEDGLKSVADKCHAAGLKIGRHCLTSFIEKNDPLVRLKSDAQRRRQNVDDSR